MTAEAVIDHSSQVPEPSKRAVIYLRVASRQPDDLAAIERQRAACQRLAREYRVEIIREYADVGRSGRSGSRPGLHRLQAELETRPKIHYVIVEDVARLSRSHLLHQRLVSALMESGVRLITADMADSSLARNGNRSLINLAVYGLAEPVHGPNCSPSTPHHITSEGRLIHDS